MKYAKKKKRMYGISMEQINRNYLLGSTDIELTQQRFKIKSSNERVKENHKQR